MRTLLQYTALVSPLVGQDCFLRAGLQPALYDPFCKLRQAGTNPPQVANLPHKLFGQRTRSFSTRSRNCGDLNQRARYAGFVEIEEGEHPFLFSSGRGRQALHEHVHKSAHVDLTGDLRRCHLAFGQSIGRREHCNAVR